LEAWKRDLNDRGLSWIDVVLAADDNFSLPLAVALLSVISSLREGIGVRAHILNMGITPANRAKITTAADRPNAQVNWVDTLAGHVSHLPNTWKSITRATYARLFITDVLPADVSRALYLDCDVLVRRSVHELVTSDMGGHAALGVADAGSPFVCSHYGVPWWFRNGRRADEPNFNAGVIAMDLDVWRQEDYGKQCLEYLADGRHEVAQDQEAINSILGNRIGTVDPRWNVQSELYQREFEMTLPYGPELIEQMKNDPWIVHFSTQTKPWSYGCDNPYAGEWAALLDQTPYRGTRPSLAKHLWTRGRRIPRWALDQLHRPA